MPTFDRFDIAEAHYVFATLYHDGGDTRRRDFARLSRMSFKPAPSLDLSSLTVNGLAIYGRLVLREMGRKK